MSKKKQQTLPEFAQHIYKTGFAKAEEGDYDEAISILQNIHVALPVLTATELQIGRCHWEMHRWELARQHFEIAAQLEPNNDDAGWTVGLLALQLGDFKKGWQGYERRWGSKSFKSPKLHTKHPQWERGKGLKRPLIWCEQGIGDQILYASLIEKLAEEVEHVTVMIDLRVANLFQRGCKAKNVKFISHNSKVKMSEHDSHIPIASMGKYFINSVQDIAPNVSSSYIKADPERVAMLRKEYGLREDDYIVGLTWTSTAPVIGQHKSVPLAAFLPILDTPNFKFINLQYGDAQKEGERFHPSLITTHIDTFLDLENVAALMEICNVIVSPSCANVHLAGAMGKKVLLLDANKLWYWNNKAQDQVTNLWYPTVRVFPRTNMVAPWTSQIEQVRAELVGEKVQRPTFVFFRTGEDKDLWYSRKFVRSLRETNPDAEIIMCTDSKTPEIEGVSRRFEYDSDLTDYMEYRLLIYKELGLEYPAMYLDDDMIVRQRIDPAALLTGKQVKFCRRSFDNDAFFNVEMKGLNFGEHEGKTLGEVYPYLACATVTKDWRVWDELLQILYRIDPKYRKWYGDQEAMRIYTETTSPDIWGELSEQSYACLPEYSHNRMAKIIHYKGRRKEQMR